MHPAGKPYRLEVPTMSLMRYKSTKVYIRYAYGLTSSTTAGMHWLYGGLPYGSYAATTLVFI